MLCYVFRVCPIDGILVDETFLLTPEIELNVLLMAIMVAQIAKPYIRQTASAIVQYL